MVLTVIAVIAAMLVYFNPGIFWHDTNAPWESVVAYYYPDRSDLSIHIHSGTLASAEACGHWVATAAALNNDPSLARGDYECGVGYQNSTEPLTVYRLTVR